MLRFAFEGLSNKIPVKPRTGSISKFLRLRSTWIDLWHNVGARFIRVRSRNRRIQRVRVRITGRQFGFRILHYDSFRLLDLGTSPPFDHERRRGIENGRSATRLLNALTHRPGAIKYPEDRGVIRQKNEILRQKIDVRPGSEERTRKGNSLPGL